MEKLWNHNYLKVWTGNFMIFFSFMLVMPILPLYLSEEYGAGKHTIGVVLSGYTVMALIARMFSGYIVDTFSRKKVLILSYSIFATFFLGYIIPSTLLLFCLIRTLHGAPFGTVTVSNSTVAIDVLPAKRRAEGIGYYGLSNNLATAISPTIGIYLYETTGNFNLIFLLSFFAALTGAITCSTVNHTQPSKLSAEKEKAALEGKKIHRRLASLDRFLLVDGWAVGIMLAMLSFSYGVISTYLAIYAKQELGMTEGASIFFLILSISLMVSRLTGSKSLREGRVVHNASLGMTISIFSYLIFAIGSSASLTFTIYLSAIILGLGNGHMFPAVQTMFVNLTTPYRRGTANSTMLTSWDVGIGMGVIIGGVVSETISYAASFWTAAIINALGVLFYFVYVKNDYIRKRKQ